MNSCKRAVVFEENLKYLEVKDKKLIEEVYDEITNGMWVVKSLTHAIVTEATKEAKHMNEITKS